VVTARRGSQTIFEISRRLISACSPDIKIQGHANHAKCMSATGVSF